MLSILLSCFPAKTLEQAKPEEKRSFPEEQFSYENHGVERKDPFAWLMNKEDPNVRVQVVLENERFAKYQETYQPLYQSLVSEMLERQQKLDEPFEFQQGEWTYTEKKTKEYVQIMRKKGNEEPEMLINLDELAKEASFLHLSHWDPSANNKYLMYVIDDTGNNQYTLVIYDMEKKEVFNTIPAVSENVLWLNEAEIMYVSQDERGVQHGVFIYDVDSGEIRGLYHENEKASRVSIEESLSGQFIFLYSDSETGTQILVWDREEEHAEFLFLWERQKDVQATATEFQGNFLIKTNDTHQNYRILKIDASDFSNRSVFQDSSDEIAILSVTGLSKAVVVWEKRGPLEFFRVYDEEGTSKDIEFPSAAFIGRQDIDYDYDENSVLIPFPSMTGRSKSRAYDLLTGKYTEEKEDISLDYQPSDYKEHVIVATSEDGVKIPISLLYDKNLDLSVPQPAYIETYGSYGYTFEHDFSPYRISLVQRGVLFAYCHTRGSGFYGEEWYQAGSGLNRQNSISDLITCGKELQKRGYTSPEKTVITAESAGGTIIGGAINQAPELWKAAILERPFVDLITVLSDPDNTQNPEEWQEWGNPADKEVFEVMSKYSPYDNIKKQVYPEILVTSGWNDPYVQYWEPTKLVGKLWKYNQGNGNIFLYTDMTGGHFGAQSNTGIVEDRARIYSFALNQMGISN